MNISASTIYLWQLADKIQMILLPIAGVLSAAAIILFFICMCHGHWSAWNAVKGERCADDAAACAETFRFTDRKWRTTLAAASFLWAVVILCPSSNTVAMMVVIPKIAESKVIQQDLPDIYNAAVEALKGAIKKP